ncbi:hypothetical protein NIES2100_18600 [Calothrix sp. NIES-2100]|uniref:YqhA family protein n=1 Tax=Calothrix sp. NIES-2100 TaxID=1954172 RepID=UPI000B610789|nr:hypothetical protein NIES2100_18600 [Calothrix sp. NIES-2100]
MNHKQKLEHFVETTLWTVRFLAIVPVLFGVFSVLGLFILGSAEIISGLSGYLHFKHEETAKSILSGIIGGIDMYLIGIVLMIFSFGIYELFISKIDIGRQNEEIQILEIKSLDQLKDKVLKVIVMVLVVGFFKKVLEMPISTTLDLLYLAISILLIAASSYLLRSKHDIHP